MHHDDDPPLSIEDEFEDEPTPRLPPRPVRRHRAATARSLLEERPERSRHEIELSQTDLRNTVAWTTLAKNPWIRKALMAIVPILGATAVTVGGWYFDEILGTTERIEAMIVTERTERRESEQRVLEEIQEIKENQAAADKQATARDGRLELFDLRIKSLESEMSDIRRSKWWRMGDTYAKESAP